MSARACIRPQYLSPGWCPKLRKLVAHSADASRRTVNFSRPSPPTASPWALADGEQRAQLAGHCAGVDVADQSNVELVAAGAEPPRRQRDRLCRVASVERAAAGGDWLAVGAVERDEIEAIAVAAEDD